MGKSYKERYKEYMDEYEKNGPFYDLQVNELLAYDITWDMSTTEERHQLEEEIKAEDSEKWKEFKREMILMYGSLEY